MNIIQRAILIIGAIAFVIALLMTPQYIDTGGKLGRVRYTRSAKEAPLAQVPVKDVGTAGINGAEVLGTTILLYFAAGSKKRSLEKSSGV